MSTQKIALVGATGSLSKRLIHEALNRGHKVTALVSDAGALNIKHENLTIKEGEITNQQTMNELAEGHDVLICAYEPTRSLSREHIAVVKASVEAAKEANLKRVVSYGHPSEIESAPEFHESWKPVIQAQKETLEMLQDEHGIHWSYAHTAELEPEKTSGKFRVSNLILLTNDQGSSTVPVKEYAAALMDETEKREYVWEESGVDL